MAKRSPESRLPRVDSRSCGAQTVGMSSSPSDAAAGKLVDRLAIRFPRATREHIATTVAEEYESLSDSRIRTYIPNLVERAARSRLQHEVGLLLPAG